MKNINKALQHLDRRMGERDQHAPIPFEEFLKMLTEKPSIVIRNVFQVFYDMIKTYVGEGIDEYPDDPESIHFVYYDCRQLFVEGSDHPFFADRLFANRLINHVEALKRGAQQNKIYIFEGPPGCGKSTFLNNLLRKFEEYTNTEDGACFEAVWRLDRKLLGEYESIPLKQAFDEQEPLYFTEDYIEVPCPSHDHPLLMIPKHYRRPLFDDLFANDEFKWKLFTNKEYNWVFRDLSCTICSSLYQVLLNRLGSPLEVFRRLYVRPHPFNKRLGDGISVFNPGDEPLKQKTLTNGMLQKRMNYLFKDSNQVKYMFSRYAKTNNGVYALMDIKSHNIERLIELHNIISEGVHKVEEIEENVNSLFIALMNPEDKKNVEDFQSFSDRIEYIKIPYILDLNTEVEIYRNVVGKQIDERFVSRVPHNFARVIISTRLNLRSEAMLEWIGDPRKYRLYCDENLQLLKMELYTGYIPTWLSEEDVKYFTAKRRRKIIGEAETEGDRGFSGRDSLKLFNDFYSTYARKDKLINMSMLCTFFSKLRGDLRQLIPQGFLDSLIQMYNYTILQEVKESLYNYNEEQISRDVQNYIFAVNFERGAVEICQFTGEKLEITEEFLESIEDHLLGNKIGKSKRLLFRKDTQKEYTSRTLTQEIMLEGTLLTETQLYKSMYERYVYNLKEKVLDPFLENENFRRAIKDYDTEDFKTYDKRIRNEVTFLINNLCARYQYTPQSAREVCIYVIDNSLPRKFAASS
jgi:predicted Ser/Thr protein kinase